MKFQHTMKFKLAMIMAAVVTAVVVIVCVLNSLLLEKYYTNARQKELLDGYRRLSELLDSHASTDEITAHSTELNSRYNINVFLLDSNWNTAYSTTGVSQNAAHWLQDFMFSGNQHVILEEERFTLQEGYDKELDVNYLVAYGSVNQGVILVTQVVLESVADTVSICNRFVIIVGACALLVSILVGTLIAGRFTKPVKELAGIASKMSELDFSAKYEGGDQGEIGLLGDSMNCMSANLERNISELKSANLTLMKDLELRDRTEQMRREFTSNVSHELKTPIALIQGYAEGLLESVNEEDRDYYLEVIMDEAGKMNHLVQNLLTLNQMEYGNKQIAMARFDLTELVDGVVKTHEVSCNSNEIEIVKKLTPNCYAWGDELMIEEVITNYLTNAIHHCEGSKRITVSLENREGKLYVTVENTGKQIQEEEQARIWDKFYKVDKARTRAYGGNGIGLSIVKAIMDNHRGEYGVVNTAEGVAFYFALDSH